MLTGIQQVLSEFSLSSLPRVARLTMRDVFSLLRSGKFDSDHSAVLPACMAWIARAQDATGSGGISCHFRAYGGWGPAFAETTGYLIPSLLRYAEVSSQNEYAMRAQQAGKWLLSQQNPDGGFPGGLHSGESMVFNSGQVLFGLIALARMNPSFLSAAEKTAHWLVRIQDPSGAWLRHTYEGRAHSYSTMAAWALALWTQLTGDSCCAEAARKNIDWMIGTMNGSGFPEGLGLGRRPAYLHFIAYALQGLLMVGEILNDGGYVEKATIAALHLRGIFETTGYLPGAFTPQWTSAGRYQCLTGQMQMTRVWQRLHRLHGDEKWKLSANAMLRMTAPRISLKGEDGVRGGVAGSFPIWGRYLFYRYPNWAAKFTVDAWMAHLYGEPRMEWMG